MDSKRSFGVSKGLGILATGCLLVSACTSFPAWRDKTLGDVAEGRWHVNPAQVSAGSTSSQTVEFYDAGGKHLGYGKTQGGSMEFFNVNSSRAGFGKIGR